MVMRAALVWRILLVAGSLGAVAAACTLNVEGTSVGQGPNGPDAGVDAQAPSLCAGELADCAEQVPAGWKRVGFAADRASECGGGFSALDVLADPVPAANACACGGCMITAPPSCMGDVYLAYDNGFGQCGTPGITIHEDEKGKCMGLTAKLQEHIKGTTPLPGGGACALTATADDGAISATDARVCVPSNPACEGQLCASGGAFTECIVTDGPQDCPQGPFQVKHLIGSSTSTSCSPCGCEVEATCSGTFTIFSDSSCKDNALPLTLNNKCQPTTPGVQIKSYTYEHVPSVACKTSVPSTPTLTVNEPQTLCCRSAT